MSSYGAIMSALKILEEPYERALITAQNMMLGITDSSRKQVTCLSSSHGRDCVLCPVLEEWDIGASMYGEAIYGN